MNKSRQIVITETKYIALVTVLLSALMQGILLLIGLWNYKMILSNIYSAFLSVLNFYLMGITVIKAVEKDEKEAKKLMKISLNLRTLGLFVAVAVGVMIPVFNVFGIVIPLFFPRVAIMLRAFIKPKETDNKEVNGEQ